MLCLWVHGCYPGRSPAGSRLALYQLSLSSVLLLSFSDMCFVLLFICFSRFYFVFCFVFVFMLSLELCRRSSDIFLSSRLRIGNHVYYWEWLRPDRLM